MAFRLQLSCGAGAVWDKIRRYGGHDQGKGITTRNLDEECGTRMRMQRAGYGRSVEEGATPIFSNAVEFGVVSTTGPGTAIPKPPKPFGSLEVEMP